MTNGIVQAAASPQTSRTGVSTPSRAKQKTLFPEMPFPVHATEPWLVLHSEGLPLDKDKYDKIRKCYQDIFDSFLPGQKSVPFYTQVSEQLKAEGLEITPRALARLVSRAQKLGIEHFPDPRTRAVPASSLKATKLQNPVGSLRMSLEEHNTFAEIYRTLLQTPRKNTKQVGKGFFAQAAARMRERGYEYTEKQLALYAHYRRRIGDVNFPRLRGSQDIERMQVAAIERMRALGVMATGLMHEILQPLQVIQSTAEHQRTEIARGRVEPDRMGERLERIIKQAKLVNEVVQHVRTIARAVEIRHEPVALRSTIERALTLFGEQLKSRGIEVDLNAVAGPLSVVADPIALERVFINLVTNARDAIEETGRKSGMIKFSAHERETMIVCEVEDDGTGIAEGNLDRIFDPYFTTKAVGNGTGMGLTEVFNLMVQFGGRITAANRPGNGGATLHLEFKKYGSAN